MSETKLGKITEASFGLGGYQDIMMGASFTFEGAGWAIAEFRGTWADPPSPQAQWTVESQTQLFADTTRWLKDILGKAKVKSLDQLVGVPVEVTIANDGSLESWRVLTEVL